MTEPVALLLVEDSEDDAELLRRMLGEAGMTLQMQRVQSDEGLRRALQRSWDVVVSDYAMPGFSGLGALSVVRELAPDLPVIIFSGSIGEELAVDALKAGADDYILKERPKRMPEAIRRALREAEGRRARSRMEREREELIAALRQGLRARDDFLAVASHELKTPVTTLRIQLEHCRRSLDRDDAPLVPERIAERIDAALRQADRLAELIETLLEVTRIESGQLRVDRVETDLVELTRRSASRLGSHGAAGRPQIRVNAASPVTIPVDAARIEQLLAILLSNALKYGGGKPVDVEVAALPDRAVLVVHDRGIGIPPEQVEHLFQRFQRAVSTRNYGGLGLGLFLARSIVEAHGGRIRLESPPGQGTRVTVELPRSGEALR